MLPLSLSISKQDEENLDWKGIWINLEIFMANTLWDIRRREWKQLREIRDNDHENEIE